MSTKSNNSSQGSVKNGEKELQYIDIFCGAGGMSYGLSQVDGLKPILAVDKEPSAVETHEENIDGKAIELDLTETLPGDLPVSPEEVDVVVGGPPCQDFSVANRFTRGGEKTNLVFVFAEYVDYFQPDFFIMENVVGIKSTGDVLSNLRKELKQSGYSLCTKTMNARHFGVPQNRNRVFVVGVKDGEVELTEDSKSETTVGEAFNNLPHVEAGDSIEWLDNMRPPNHQQSTIDKIESAGPGESLYESWGSKVRLDPDKVAPTLKAGQRANYHFGHPSIPRGLTIKERAIIQGFPDDFTFYGTITEQRTLTGNAVPPQMVESVGEQIVNQLNQ